MTDLSYWNDHILLGCDIIYLHSLFCLLWPDPIVHTHTHVRIIRIIGNRTDQMIVHQWEMGASFWVGKWKNILQSDKCYRAGNRIHIWIYVESIKFGEKKGNPRLAIYKCLGTFLAWGYGWGYQNLWWRINRKLRQLRASYLGRFFSLVLQSWVFAAVSCSSAISFFSRTARVVRHDVRCLPLHVLGSFF